MSSYYVLDVRDTTRSQVIFTIMGLMVQWERQIGRSIFKYCEKHSKGVI